MNANGSRHRTTYQYDALNRLESVTSGEGSTTYGYDAVGNRTSISYPNGSSQRYHYDALNRLVRLQVYNGSGALVQQYDYTLDPTGRRTAIDELDGRQSRYQYDALYRLTEEHITDPSGSDHLAQYQYDPVGNRLYQIVNGVHTAYQYDDNDRLLQAGGTTYQYDANGNTLSEANEGTTTRYYYDSQNQLTEVNGGMVRYRYNIDGIRTGKEEGGLDTDYVVDSNRDYAQVLQEDDGNHQVLYLYGDDLISQQRDGATHYYHYDGLGSTRALSDTNGTVTDRYDYEAFGELLNQVGTTDNAYRYTGEQYDASLGQYYLRARYYDQSVGRFTQMDTWAGNSQDPITLHKYLYANADPAI